MFRPPSRTELSEEFILTVVAVFAGAYCMWLVWCGATVWRKWSGRRKLAGVSASSSGIILP